MFWIMTPERTINRLYINKVALQDHNRTERIRGRALCPVFIYVQNESKTEAIIRLYSGDIFGLIFDT